MNDEKVEMDESELEIPVDTKRIIIEQQVMLWKNTLYQQRLLYRTNKAIGAEANVLDLHEREVKRCLAMLDQFAKELKALEG